MAIAGREVDDKPRVDIYTGDKGPRFGSRHVQMLVGALGAGVMSSTSTMFNVLLVAMMTEDPDHPDIPYYKWNNSDDILSSIMWSSLLFQLCGGHLGKEYGPKWFIVAVCAINALAFGLTPFAAAGLGATGVIICRVIQGAALGLNSPLQTCYAAAWIPSEERARLSLIGIVGVTLCLMASSMLAGLVSGSSWGWPWGFYIFGLINAAYTFVWAFVAHQSPASHPTITPAERTYIETSLKQRKPGEKIPTPWLKLFTSIYVWANIIAFTGLNFTMTLFLTEKSMFLSKIMKMGIEMNGIVGSVPILGGTVGGIVLAYASDYSIKSGLLSVLNSRRIFQVVGACLEALCLILITYIPSDHSVYVIALLCFESVCVVTCITGGSSLNIFDISPLYAGIIQGISSALGDLTGLIAPFLAGWCIKDKEDVSQWRLTFAISGAISASSAIFFAIFATDQRQEWEKDNKQPKDDRRESILSIEKSISKF